MIKQYKFSSNSVSNLINPDDIFSKKQDEVDNGSLIYSDYRFEAARLKSFKNWPCSWKEPEELAAAGFYYTGESDKVRCFECDKELCQWKAEDNPMVDHQRWSGRCRFVRNIPCGNVLIGIDPNTIPAFVPKGMDICGSSYGLTYMFYSGSDHENQEIEKKVNHRKFASGPKHPEYTSYSARLASYDRWPKVMSQTKEDLVTAGFYYSGSSDETLCYYCGGGLKDWEPNDDPWVEHAKWFDKCPYLLLTKGIQFVSNITGKTYIGTENIPFAVKLDKKFEGDDSESIASGSSQNSISSEETNTTEVSIVSDETSSKEQSVQIKDVESCNKDYARLCKICFNREMRIAFIPCGHLLACAECAKDMKICGVCRKNVELTVQVYIS